MCSSLASLCVYLCVVFSLGWWFHSNRSINFHLIPFNDGRFRLDFCASEHILRDDLPHAMHNDSKLMDLNWFSSTRSIDHITIPHTHMRAIDDSDDCWFLIAFATTVHASFVYGFNDAPKRVHEINQEFNPIAIDMFCLTFESNYQRTQFHGRFDNEMVLRIVFVMGNWKQQQKKEFRIIFGFYAICYFRSSSVTRHLKSSLDDELPVVWLCHLCTDRDNNNHRWVSDFNYDYVITFFCWH